MWDKCSIHAFLIDQRANDQFSLQLKVVISKENVFCEHFIYDLPLVQNIVIRRCKDFSTQQSGPICFSLTAQVPSPGTPSLGLTFNSICILLLSLPINQILHVSFSWKPYSVYNVFSNDRYLFFPDFSWNQNNKIK